MYKGREIYFPCGTCYQCVRRRKLDWEIRLTQACNHCSSSYFHLLTYDEEHYPENDHDFDFMDREIQTFVKRLRRGLEYHFGKHVKLRYFIASELGEQFNRLHYHCLFFVYGVDMTWQEMNVLIKKYWTKGVVGNTYKMTSKSIRYCCKYIQKQSNKMWYSQFRVRDVAPDVEKIIRCDSNVYDIDRHPKIAYGSRLVSLPKYWLRCFLSPNELRTYNSLRLNRFEELSKLESFEQVVNKEKLYRFKQSLEDNKNPRPSVVYRFPSNSDITNNDDF